jgi:hypothetical protein
MRGRSASRRAIGRAGCDGIFDSQDPEHHALPSGADERTRARCAPALDLAAASMVTATATATPAHDSQRNGMCGESEDRV